MSYDWKTVGYNWGNSSCMVNWGMVKTMGYSWNNWGSMKSCVMGNWGMYCSCVMDPMSNNWGSMNSMVNWGMMNSMGNSWYYRGSVKRSMVGNWMDSMVGNWMDCMMGNWMDSMMGNWMDWYWDWFAVFIKLGFWKEWIEKRISIESVQFWGSIAVDSIPSFTSEEMLVKQCSIWTDEPSPMRTVSSVFT